MGKFLDSTGVDVKIKTHSVCGAPLDAPGCKLSVSCWGVLSGTIGNYREVAGRCQEEVGRA